MGPPPAGRERELGGSLRAAGSKRKGACACPHPLAPGFTRKRKLSRKRTDFLAPVVPLDFAAPRSVKSPAVVADCVHAFVDRSTDSRTLSAVLALMPKIVTPLVPFLERIVSTY